MTRHEPKTHRAIPNWMYPFAAIAVLFLVIPIWALLWRLPWLEIGELITAPASIDALWLSVWTCSVATLLCVIFGAPLSLWCSREDQYGPWQAKLARLTRGVLRLPMVLPPVVAGLVLLQTWGRYGLLGQYLDLFGWRIAFTSVAVVIAQTFISLPFFFASFESALRASGHKYERQARILGAPSNTIFWQITMPLVRPALASAAALAFARALGEFGATLTFAGSLQGVTRTIPLDIYLLREDDTGQALALSLVLIILAIALAVFAQFIGKSAKWQTEEHRDKRPANPESDTVKLAAQTEAVRQLAEKLADSKTGPQIRVQAQVPERKVTIDTTFPAGQTTALVGPNGSGKSTLLSVLSGTLGYDGQVDLGLKKVGILEQKPVLFPHFTNQTNIEFALRFSHPNLNRAARAERAAQALAAVGTSHLAKRYPSQLSGGEKQRVAIARLAAGAPEIVLLDEPLSALDEDAAKQARQLLKEVLAALKATTVLVTHHSQDVLELAHWMVVLKQGKVYRRGEPDALLGLLGDDPQKAKLAVVWS
ncbi:molybdenum ABC transporter permease subunit [Boudabousia tangfeifanii]|uniref:Molybdenum ABC transporter permease subunit n=1 Tax=Boudabousia tangfeifanii TaxID=1912795 RepID=A0A1D9ML66_9ACTO|nr:molybdate ABC transporter permease subunit [Boudabousia tangfeifanii]AOZ73042.1 molybdenum ABC transporter permease subunit [Boudabousia tangfeifanii]